VAQSTFRLVFAYTNGHKWTWTNCASFTALVIFQIYVFEFCFYTFSQSLLIQNDIAMQTHCLNLHCRFGAVSKLCVISVH